MFCFRQDSLTHPKREDLFQTFSTTNAFGIYTFIKCSSPKHDILTLSKYFLFFVVMDIQVIDPREEMLHPPRLSLLQALK